MRVIPIFIPVGGGGSREPVHSEPSPLYLQYIELWQGWIGPFGKFVEFLIVIGTLAAIVAVACAVVSLTDRRRSDDKLKLPGVGGQCPPTCPCEKVTE